MDKKQIVVGFSVEKYSIDNLESLSDREKHEYFLEDSESMSYDNVKDFFNDLNRDFVDTENYFWFIININ